MTASSKRSGGKSIAEHQGTTEPGAKARRKVQMRMITSVLPTRATTQSHSICCNMIRASRERNPDSGELCGH